MISCLQEKVKHQDEQIRRLKEEVSTSTKRIADLTAGWNTSISVAHDAAVDFQKFMADNLVPESPDVDGDELIGQVYYRILEHVGMRADNIFNSALEADETLTEIRDSPRPYSPDPAKDEEICKPY
jgi:hypothetical protein